jgi:phospholipid/cholesterol/gamma-HCH transport system substrate-binding protein
VISADVAPATADLRTAAERMTASVEQVAADLPAVSAELKATLGQAADTIRRIDTVVQRSAGPIDQFTTQGLPQFVRFTQEAQTLIQRLDRIAGQLERDPARFLLRTPAPDFRR